MDSLHVTDQQSEAVATAPRVRLSDIEETIAACYYMSAYDAAATTAEPLDRALKNLTLCIVMMKNGFVVIGKSAPASPENFDAELGRKFAYEDAVRQLWPLMGFALRDRLSRGEAA